VAELADTLEPSADDRLDQAESLVRRACGWHIAGIRDEVVTFQARGEHALPLPTLQVVNVSDVTVNGETLDPTLYTLDRNSLLRGTGDYCDGWARASWYGTVEVTMRHGYAVTPAEVTGVVQAIARRAVDNPTGATSWQVGMVRSTISDAGMSLLDSEKAALAPYRLPKLA
jgi:hypothetical protein